MSFDTLNDHFAGYSEMIATHWGSVAAFDGHVASVADELDRLETTKTFAVEAASGYREGGKY